MSERKPRSRHSQTRFLTCLFTAVASAITIASPAESFVATGSMPEARQSSRAARLPDGRVLVTGGVFFADSGAFLYNPSTGTFCSVGAMTVAPGRTQHTLTLLTTGNLLVAGGWNPFGGGSLNSAQLYNPTTSTFTATGGLATARNDHTATPLPSGQILLAGGQAGIGVSLASAELYTPETGLFGATGALATARYSHVAAALPGGRVLVAGWIRCWRGNPGVRRSLQPRHWKLVAHWIAHYRTHRGDGGIAC